MTTLFHVKANVKVLIFICASPVTSVTAIGTTVTTRSIVMMLQMKQASAKPGKKSLVSMSHADK